MHQLVLLRHGESTWNKENRFTGWTDVDLSEIGVQEAIVAGRQLKSSGFVFDVAFTSVLKRAIRTLWLVLDEIDLMWIPVHRSWRLNERHYGALQGLDKSETAQLHSEEQVLLWRRGYAIQPPPLSRDDVRFPGNDPRYSGLNPDDIPLTESLADNVARFMPYWNDEIVPCIKANKRVLIAAHGNTLRALVKHLDEISDADIPELNIPTGIPLVYELDDDLKPLSHRFLADASVVEEAMSKVVAQGKSKG